MITLSDLQKEYLAPIKFKNDISKFIHCKEAQKYIAKAIKGNLNDSDISNLYKIGSKKSNMPNLYWLCTIYIHPLTTTAFIFKKLIKDA